MNPIISIIVPVYNAQEYLSRCINSILSQTFTNFEILLINDGSIDKSKQICEEYAKKDKRIRIYHGNNHGVTHARKKGVTLSKGNYLCFIDADDYILPHYLSELYKALSLTGGDISYASCSNGEVDNLHYIRMLLCNTCDWGLPYKLYRRSLFQTEVLDIPRNINVGEDLIANIKISLRAHNVILIKCNGYIYYKNMKSITHTRVFSLAYEEMFMQEVEKALGNKHDYFLNELWIFKLRSWKNLVLHRIKVDRNKDWIQWILANANTHRKNIMLGDKILLNISNYNLAFFLLKSLDILKYIFRY